jgi:hypothetical protein
MKLIDVWTNLHSELGFYNKRNFADVPAAPGVYAWFYPLQICSYDPESFFQDISNVFNYDADVGGVPEKDVSVKMSWRNILMKVALGDREPSWESFKVEWDRACASESSFNALRKVFYKSSILMPPLYVGKTDNLHRRCHQHLFSSGFSERFTQHAGLKNFQAASKVSDLLLICVRTRAEHDFSGDFEGMIEEYLKYLTKPVYSKR